jgi:hypothetical protein
MNAVDINKGSIWETNPDPLKVDFKEIMDFFEEFKNEIVYKQRTSIMEMLEKAIRENAIPKVNGKLTKGKLKWRGIRIMHTKLSSDFKMKTWIEQRGRRISPIIQF